ncbi:MAG: hypothetical protein ABII82_02175 [Verrucomicrobiota bacterium]
MANVRTCERITAWSKFSAERGVQSGRFDFSARARITGWCAVSMRGRTAGDMRRCFSARGATMGFSPDEARALGIEHDPELPRAARLVEGVARALRPGPAESILSGAKAKHAHRRGCGRKGPENRRAATRSTSSEHNEQRRLVEALDAAGVTFFAIPNGGARTKAEAGRLKAEGVRAGVVDLILLDPPPLLFGYVGVALEMKAPSVRPKTDRAHRWSGARPEQRAWLQRFEDRDWIALVAYGCDDALERLRELGYDVEEK